MTWFYSYSDILPDPVNLIGRAGQGDRFSDTSAEGPGAGFASVKLRSTDSLLNSITSSRRRNTKAASYHKWMIDITYHPMTREEFDPVYSFLALRKMTLAPFYVELPQYTNQTSGGTSVQGDHVRGSETVLVNSTLDTIPPEIFSIGENSKIYMVTRTETNTDWYTYNVQPEIGQERFHITPGLAYDTLHDEALNFTDPRFFVKQVGDTIDYSINANNLYSFSLKLEEVPINVTD